MTMAIRRGAGSVHSPLRGKSGLSRQTIGVNWDPKLHGYFSPLEVENSDENPLLWVSALLLSKMVTTTSDGSIPRLVGDRCPETMLGDCRGVNPKR